MFPGTVWTTIRRAGEDDREALERFASAYRPPVLRFLQRRGFSSTDAEDLCQEVFLRLIRGRVLSRAESEPNAVHYGPEAGTITLVVFRERKDRVVAPPLDDEGEDLAAISRGTMPAESPETLAGLKFRLRQDQGRGGSRGLIVEGPQIGAATRTRMRAAPRAKVHDSGARSAVSAIQRCAARSRGCLGRPKRAR